MAQKLDKSLFFEEFKRGDKFFSEQRRITEDDVKEFVKISGDDNPLHTDDQFAKTTKFGKRISHGLLGLSAVSGLAADLGFAKMTTLAFRSLEWKFKQPVLIGDTIKAVFEVIEKRDLPGDVGGLLIFRVSVFNQDEKLVQIGKWSLVIKKK
jgi:acyl dehydratase